MWWMEFTTSVVNLFLFLSCLSALSLLSGLSDQSAIRIPARALRRRWGELAGPNSAMGSEDDRFLNGFDDLLWFIDQLKDFQIRG